MISRERGDRSGGSLVSPHMQTPATPKPGLRLAFAALALLGSACTTAAEPGDDDRLAVVFITDDGRDLAVGTYDAESGELTFVDRAQDDMRERLGDAGYAASLDLDGDVADIDLEAGVALVAVDLEDGDALELRVARAGAQTLTLGRLVLQDGDAFRKLGNKLWDDDWLAPI